MWAIRRAGNPIRNQSCCILFNHTFYTKPATTSNLENGIQNLKGYVTSGAYPISKHISHGGFWPAPFFSWGRNLSSGVGTTLSDNEDNFQDVFSDIVAHPENDKIEEHDAKNNDELFSEGDTAEGDSDEVDVDSLALPDTETNGEKRAAKKFNNSQLLRVLMDTPRNALYKTLDKWLGGNILEHDEMSSVVSILKNRRLYLKALQFMEWADETKRIEFNERDYATRLDLITKVHGVQKAEQYAAKVPKSFRGEALYRALLTGWVSTFNVKKAEEVMNKMKDLGIPLTAFSYNQLILLYKRVDRKKIGDVLRMMEKEGLKPSPFTYTLLIDAKGRSHDVSGMEEIIASMKTGGMKLDVSTQALIANHYILAGQKSKAKEILKDIEGEDIAKNRAACIPLLPLYGALRQADNVERIWKVCEGSPKLEECFAAIEAWGKLGKIDEVERVSEKMLKSWRKLPPKYYNLLMKVYADHKLLSKGKDLAQKMLDDGCFVGPLTWDALVKLYVEAGELDKADAILQRASEQGPVKPLYNTYIYLLEKYADSGDIHNAEKLFQWLRRIGYAGRMPQYQLLLQAYVNAKMPAYGFRERMKADNLSPNRGAMEKLQAVDAFRRGKYSGLLVGL